MCDYFDVSRSGFYDYVNRGDDYQNSYDSKRLDLAKVIVKINNKSPSKGYRKINDQIVRETGWVVTDWMVHKVCKSLGIKSAAGKYTRKTIEGEEHVKFPRLFKNRKTTRAFEKVS